ncbi:vitamin B12 transporter [Alteromonadaceae bacterium Bs31]|nr:vitamin B12 transporter [Alteromonadaceae bacterium Bs31]
MKPSFYILSAALMLLLSPVHASERLEELVVTSSRNATPLRQVGASVSVITEADIQLQVAQTLNELLRNQPGITVSNSGGLGANSTLRIRGEEGYRTLIMIDGIEMTDPTGTQAMSHVEHLSLSNEIDRIEILRGPQGFIYGADAGGVINIFTRSSSEGMSGGFAAEVGSYNTRRLNASLNGGNQLMDGFVSVAQLSSDGFNARETDKSGEEDGYDNTTVHAKGGINFNQALRAQLVYRDQSAESEYDSCGSSNDCLSKFDQAVGRVSLEYNRDDFLQSLAYSYSDIERLFLTDGEQVYAISGGMSKAEYFGQAALSSALTTVWGLDHKKETLDGRDGDADNSREQLGLFAELQANVNDAVYFTGGVRYDDNEDFGRYNSYRLTAAWLPFSTSVHTLKLRSSVGTGFRAPSLSELAYNDGPWASGAAVTTVLDAEESEGVDIGVDYYRALSEQQALSVEFTLFDQKVENEIYYDLIDYSGYLQAQGETRSYGSELLVDFSANKYLALIFSSTWNPTEMLDDSPRARRPENSENLGVRVNLLNDELKLLANIYSARKAIDIDGTEMDDYRLVSLSANWVLNNWLLSAKIDNLTNREYQQVSSYNTAERSFHAGVQFSF